MKKCLEELKAGIWVSLNNLGKSLMNAFLCARTAFCFEHLISFRAEHSDAAILWELNDFFSKIDEIDTKNKEKTVSKIQSWQNK